MTYVENGVEFTRCYGDIDEQFYSSVESVLDELASLFRSTAREHYPEFHDRLAKLVQLTDRVGWGLHDFIADVLDALKSDLAKS